MAHAACRLDARALVGIAHPLRVRIRDHLRRHGPSTATQLAAQFGESSGATSYHLRMLARYGLVERDPEHPTGRERWWRATPGHFQIVLSELSGDDLTREALRLVSGELREIADERMRAWLVDRERWSPAWRDGADNSTLALRLTADEMRRLRDDIWVLIDAAAAMPPSPGSRTVELELNLFPTGHPE